MGRAKAYFLSGNSSSSIIDLDKAEELSPHDPTIEKLRRVITTGDSNLLIPVRRWGDDSDELKSAIQSLENGDGIQAFCDYSALESSGWSPGYSKFGKAISCIAENDPDGARNYLNGLEKRSGTAMAINIAAACVFISILDREEGVEKRWLELETARQEYAAYSLEISPLASLLKGLRTKKKIVSIDQIDRMENLLSSPILPLSEHTADD